MKYVNVIFYASFVLFLSGCNPFNGFRFLISENSTIFDPGSGDGGAPPVLVGSVDDGTTGNSATISTQITWPAATGDINQIDYYEVSVGTISGAQNIIPWTNVGQVLTYQFTSGAFNHGTTYFANVRLRKKDGSYTTPILGNGWSVSLTPKLFTSVAGGRYSMCALATDGTVYCSGDRSAGQLGDGNNGEVFSPRPIITESLGGAKFSKLAIGLWASCGIATDGKAYCWGQTNAPLGTGADHTYVLPVEVNTTAVVGAPTFIDISNYQTHACAISTAGAIYCWGIGNSSGQLGIGSTTVVQAPTAVDVSALAPADRTFIAVAVGEGHSCAISTTKKAFCWGLGTSGQIGNASSVTTFVPLEVNTAGISGNKNFSKIFAGMTFSCAIMEDNATYCWGAGNRGQLGNNTILASNVPVAPDTSGIVGFTHFKTLSLGAEFACGQTNSDAMYCWGYNNRGQIGNGTTTNVSVPTYVNINSNSTVKMISAGKESTCGQTSNGSVYCWGAGSLGQLGQGVSVTQELNPVLASSLFFDVNTIASFSARDGRCVHLTTNEAYCWGDNLFGQLPVDKYLYGPVKTNTTNLSGDKKFKNIAAGSYHNCAISSDDKLYCWGQGTSGELGNGQNLSRNLPVATDLSMLAIGEVPIQVSAGEWHTCMLTSANKAYCWGEGGNGQLGRNSTVDSNIPVLVDTTDIVGNKNFSKIAVGSFHSCGITQDFAMHCWGHGGFLQLGQGAGGDRLRPATVAVDTILTSKNFADMGLGQRHSCAVMDDGEAYCWGTGSAGRLGDGTGANRSKPALVLKTNVTGNLFATKISSGEAHACMQMQDNAMFCWGYNAEWQVGDGTQTNALTPLAVSTLAPTLRPALTDMIVSRAHTTFVLAADQNIYGVGWGRYGQMGALEKRTTNVFTPMMSAY